MGRKTKKNKSRELTETQKITKELYQLMKEVFNDRHSFWHVIVVDGVVIYKEKIKIRYHISLYRIIIYTAGHLFPITVNSKVYSYDKMEVGKVYHAILTTYPKQNIKTRIDFMAHYIGEGYIDKLKFHKKLREIIKDC